MRSQWPLVATCTVLVTATLVLAALSDGRAPAAPAAEVVAVDETVAIEVPALRVVPGRDGNSRATTEVPRGSGSLVVEGHALVDLRVWQHVNERDDTWLSARVRGGSWETAPLVFDRGDGMWIIPGRHRYHDFTIDLVVTRVELRLWQRLEAPELFYVRACPVACSSFVVPAHGQPVPYWAPLGMVAMPLDDGYGPLGLYRHGGVTVAVPVNNPGLRADREYLLALRDALAGTATLNWSPATPTGEWEGVRLAGTPLRVSALDLADRGLDGEVLGWLGDLAWLRELRLDGNRLAGTLPSKLAALTRLTHVYLAGNDLDGCVPPPLRNLAHSDLALLQLPDCEPPERLRGSTTWSDLVHRSRGLPVAPGTYRWPSERGVEYVLDLPAGPPFDIFHHWDAVARADPIHEESCRIGSRCGIDVVLLHSANPYRNPVSVALDLDTGQELERSHYREEDPALSAILDRIAASVWANRAVGDSGEWVWP